MAEKTQMPDGKGREGWHFVFTRANRKDGFTTEGKAHTIYGTGKRVELDLWKTGGKSILIIGRRLLNRIRRGRGTRKN